MWQKHSLPRCSWKDEIVRVKTKCASASTCMLPFLDQCHFLEKKVGNHHHSDPFHLPKPHQYSNTLQETTICISWMLFCLLKPHSLLLRFGSFVVGIIGSIGSNQSFSPQTIIVCEDIFQKHCACMNFKESEYCLS